MPYFPTGAVGDYLVVWKETNGYLQGRGRGGEGFKGKQGHIKFLTPSREGDLKFWERKLRLLKMQAGKNIKLKGTLLTPGGKVSEKDLRDAMQILDTDPVPGKKATVI